MAIKNRDLIVVMDDSEHGAAGEYVVQLRLGDQTRAELEARKLGMKATDMPINLQAFMAWAAMVRSGHFDGTARKFIDACVYAEDSKGSDEAVDPTQQAATSD